MPDAPQPANQPTLEPSPSTLRPPLVRLQTWVNVVLVLILLASCSGAGDVTNLVVRSDDGSSVASQDDVTDLCRLLGAVAEQQGVDLDTVFASSTADTQCQDAARETPSP